MFSFSFPVLKIYKVQFIYENKSQITRKYFFQIHDFFSYNFELVFKSLTDS